MDFIEQAHLFVLILPALKNDYLRRSTIGALSTLPSPLPSIFGGEEASSKKTVNLPIDFVKNLRAV